MRLSELIHGVPGLTAVATPAGSVGDPIVTSVTDDSRRVVPGALFVARPGAKGDGACFIADALTRGALAILALPAVIEKWRRDAGGTADGAYSPTSASSVAWIATEAPARAAGMLAQAAAGWPTRALRVVGVTGTNGKTTVATLVRQLLDAAGVRCGLIGTVEVHDGVRSVPASLTTPGAEALADAFRGMVANGCRAASMEVSSHALDQERTAGVEFEAGIFTNLTGDHLDYHGTMDAYASAKARLFDALSGDATAIVNATDPACARMVRDCRARVIKCSFGSPAMRGHGEREQSASVEIHETSLAGAVATFHGPWGSFRCNLPLVGRHNAMNALQSIAAAHRLGVPTSVLAPVVAQLAAPAGRLQPVTAPDAPFQVLVDYAHSDDALANVLTSVRATVAPPGRVIVLFGCGGDRDATKRPRMAAEACRRADMVVVTSDNPRTEAPEAIIDQIMTGVPRDAQARVQREVDRERAIDMAISAAQPGDVVVLAGKGHEDYQIIGTVKRHFDDRTIARGVLDRLGIPVMTHGSRRVGAECRA